MFLSHLACMNYKRLSRLAGQTSGTGQMKPVDILIMIYFTHLVDLYTQLYNDEN